MPCREGFNRDIAVALAENNIAGLDQLKYLPVARSASKYPVHCTRDGASWTGYLGFATSGNATEPFTRSTEWRHQLPGQHGSDS